jgi:hypothetical protein
MLRRTLVAVLTVAAMTVAASAGAQFLAADLLYIPGAAHSDGDNGSRWRSDLFFTNVEQETEIDLAIVYLPTGNISNATRFVDRSTWLGGRESDGFGIIDPVLADIPAGGTVVLRDPIGEYWPNDQGTANFGALVIFAYEANTLEDDGTRVNRNVIVNSRVYTPFTHYQPDPDNEGEFVEVEGTYGQTMPGVPWYNLADPSAVGDDRDFSFQILSGAGENADFRYNVGILNASDPLTTISIVIQPFQGNGEPFLGENEQPLLHPVTLQPLAQIQYNNIFDTLFGLDDVPDDATIDIAFTSWASGSSVPIVGMTVYGTLIDNTTNDPTAALPAFAFPYDIQCMWPTNTESKSTPPGVRRVSERPLEIPPR